MKKLLMMIGAAITTGASFPSFADTSATYSQGAESLADGKILLEYSGASISKLTMTPGVGEKLVMGGDSLPFAAGARVVLGRNGESVVSNTFTTAGKLNFEGDESQLTWTTSNRGLKKNSYETLFKNVDLATITPIDATPVSFLAYGKDARKVCHVNRGVDGDGYSYLRFEYQTLAKSSSAVRGIYVELRQNGANVEGRVIKAATGTILSVSNFGSSLFYDVDTSLFADTFNFNYSNIYAADTTSSGFGISSLTVGPDGGSRLTLPVAANLTLSKSFAGGGVTLAFAAAAANVTVTASAANEMTNTAYVVKGDQDHKMTFVVNATGVLPSGTTDVYGDGTVLRISGGSASSSTGILDGKSVVTMHDGSVLESRKGWPFHPTAQTLVLDAATLSLNLSSKYVNNLTLANGSGVSASENNAGSNVGYKGNALWNVTGTGVSTCDVSLTMLSNGNTVKTTTFDVEDTVAGDGVDFIASGDILIPAGNHKKAVFVKSGEGTMRIDGNFLPTNETAQVKAGTLLLNKSGATTTQVNFSLQGGTLALGDGRSNTIGSVTLSESSGISVGDGATLTISSLTVPDGATLAINGDVINHVKVETALDAATLSRILVNGKAAYQSGSGYFIKRGLIISIH